MIFLSQGREKSGEGLMLGWNANYFRFGFYGMDLDTEARYPITGKWRHWVVTYDAASRKRSIYLDGIHLASDTYSSYKGSGNLILGTTAWFGSNYYRGVIDEVRIYNKSLNETDISQLYEFHVKGNTNGISGPGQQEMSRATIKPQSTEKVQASGSQGSVSASKDLMATKPRIAETKADDIALFQAADRVNEKIGFVNNLGDIVIPLEYDAVMDWHEGLCAVKKNSKWGFIDKQNNLVIDYTFKSCIMFKEGLAKVEDFDGKRYYINKKGEKVFEVDYNFMGTFSHGLCKVGTKSYKYGFINKKGELVIPCIYNSVSDFSEGLACVTKDGKYGYIDTKGNVVIPFKFVLAGNQTTTSVDFSEGLAVVHDSKTDKFGFIDKAGRQVIPFLFEEVESFSNGLASIYMDGKFGFINKAGKMVIPNIYDQVESFHEGMASVKRGKRWGAIDTKGQEVVPVEMFVVNAFKNGLAMVQFPNENDFSYINLKGRKVFEYYATDVYTEASDISISGGRYTGRLKNGRPDGYGKISYPDGSWYEGNFKNGSSHGKGTLRDKTGLRYTGSFENGVANGSFKIERYTLMGLVSDEWTAVYVNGKKVSSTQTSSAMTDLLSSGSGGSASGSRAAASSSSADDVKKPAKTPSVRSIKFEKTIQTFVFGTTDKYFVTFDNAVTGYLFCARKTGQWFTDTGLESITYDSKENALLALYELKDKGTVRKEGIAPIW